MAVQVDTEKTVLLIFSDLMQSRLLRRILEAKLGVQVLESTDINDAQKIILKPQIHLIILDDWIGRASGVEFTRLLRGQLGIKKIPIILSMVGTDQSKIDEAKNAGVNAVLNWPTALGELIGVAESLLNAP